MLPLILEYSTLKIIWWLLLGVLLIGFAVLGGIDLGAATLLPIIGKNDVERRVIINSIGPTWESNQVWLILGAGAIFAAWPTVYALAFSEFYVAMFMALYALILRPVGFDFRSKIENPRWRGFWDKCLFIGGIIPSLIFGIAIGNVMQGIPFSIDEHMRFQHAGGFFDLFTPFTLYGGIYCVSLFIMQGSAFLLNKTGGPINYRAKKILQGTALLNILFFIIGYIFVQNLYGYQVISEINYNGFANPLAKKVEKVMGGWHLNFISDYKLYLFPVLAMLSYISVLIISTLNNHREKILMFLSSLSLIFVITTYGASMYPFIIPSSISPNFSLTVWDSSSSQATLFIMLLAVLIFFPIVLLYIRWLYKVLHGKINANDINQNSKGLY